jgi:hypothetical protein
MSYVLQRHRYYADIVDWESGHMVARVYITERQPYPVCDHRGRFLFSVWELDEAPNEFQRSCKDHKARWEPVYTSESQSGLPRVCVKRTPYADFCVQSKFPEGWIALRDGMPLLDGNRVVTFPSCGAAQAAADKHARETFESCTADDGLHWSYDGDEDYEDDDEPWELRAARLLERSNYA